jgi:hypothetical protein
VKLLFMFELIGELFSYFMVLSLACECVMREDDQSEGFSVVKT